jgi:GH25 family lysozyme M1 (1,4-beta-N-acetylmuramidase)
VKTNHCVRGIIRWLAVLVATLTVFCLPATAQAKGKQGDPLLQQSVGLPSGVLQDPGAAPQQKDDSHKSDKTDKDQDKAQNKGLPGLLDKAKQSDPGIQQPPAPAPAKPKPSKPAGEGIDVSEANGNIDWHAVRDSGRSWAIVKATEGTNYNDKWFNRARVDAMRSAGVKPGFYHFARPGSGRTGTQEADHFLQVVRDAGGLEQGDISPVLDIEVTKLDPQGTADYVRSFVQRVHDVTGQSTTIYTGYYFWKDSVSSQGNMGSAAVWIASYGAKPKTPAGWQQNSVWQYSESGHVNGVNGSVDLDNASGDVPVVDTQPEQPSTPAATPVAQTPEHPVAPVAPATANPKPVVVVSKAKSPVGSNFELAAMLALLTLLIPLTRLDVGRRHEYVSALAQKGQATAGLFGPAGSATYAGLVRACEATAKRLEPIAQTAHTGVVTIGQAVALPYKQAVSAFGGTSAGLALLMGVRSRRRRRRLPLLPVVIGATSDEVSTLVLEGYAQQVRASLRGRTVNRRTRVHIAELRDCHGAKRQPAKAARKTRHPSRPHTPYSNTAALPTQVAVHVRNPRMRGRTSRLVPEQASTGANKPLLLSLPPPG